MSSPVPFPPPGFDDLSKDEQLMYIEELSNYVNTLEPAPVPDWHWEILDRRMADPREALENGITWEEFEKELKRT